MKTYAGKAVILVTSCKSTHKNKALLLAAICCCCWHKVQLLMLCLAPLQQCAMPQSLPDLAQEGFPPGCLCSAS
jgi:hypothetical protein